MRCDTLSCAGASGGLAEWTGAERIPAALELRTELAPTGRRTMYAMQIGAQRYRRQGSGRGRSEGASDPAGCRGWEGGMLKVRQPRPTLPRLLAVVTALAVGPPSDGDATPGLGRGRLALRCVATVRAERIHRITTETGHFRLGVHERLI